jgi:protein-L-isoaspartate(D-aspartate) O-methyltransferase
MRRKDRFGTGLFVMLLPLLAGGACDGNGGDRESTAGSEQAPARGGPAAGDDYADEREHMVRDTIASRDVTDERVLRAMRTVPRHEFVPEGQRGDAYADHPLPIGHEQTISQPYIVAIMSQLAQVEPGDTVLEVGTGSGYQAAVLAEMGVEVYSIEIVEPLARSAQQTLSRLGYRNVHVRAGDGYAGWPEHAPFDAIVITAAPPRVPEPLEEQLKVGGRMVVPVGEDGMQNLMVLTRTADGFEQSNVIPVRFVPMTGEAQRPENR